MIELLNAPASVLIGFPTDVVICDPPYREWVHSKATSQSKGGGTRHRDLEFDHLTDQLREEIAAVVCRTARWSLIYSDVESTHLWRESVGMDRYVRTIPWIRWSMPNLTGTMPPQGWEAISVFHSKGKKHWNGRGDLVDVEHQDGTIYEDVPMLDGLRHLCLRGAGKHKAEKPLDQMLDLVSWFSDPDEVVCDLTAGSGATAMACKILGRSFVGTEYNPKHPEIYQRAQERLTSDLPERDKTRVERFCHSVMNDDSAMTEKSKARLALRLDDAQRAAQYL